MRGDAPIYLDAEIRPKLGAEEQVAVLRSLRVEPEYKLVVDAPATR